MTNAAAAARPTPLLVAVLGAESTGKTTLAQGLALALAQPRAWLQGPGPGQAANPLRTAWVPEVLRQWCDQNGRTPKAHEQAAILEQQHARIDAAAAEHDVVVCDTTGLMTAVYTALIFGDHSLHPRALQLHRRMHLSLLTALDLPWVPDGHQRDGPHVRWPVDSAIRHLLMQHGLPFAVIGGSGPVRLQQALAAVAPLLRVPSLDSGLAHPATTSTTSTTAPAAEGLFTRLQQNPDSPARWLCECCGDAPYERALRLATAS